MAQKTLIKEGREDYAQRPGQPLYYPRRKAPTVTAGTVKSPAVTPPAQKTPEQLEQERRQNIVNMLEKPQRQLSFRAAGEGYTQFQRQETPIAEEEKAVVAPVSPPDTGSQNVTPGPSTGPTEQQQRAIEAAIRREQIQERRAATGRKTQIA